MKIWRAGGGKPPARLLFLGRSTCGQLGFLAATLTATLAAGYEWSTPGDVVNSSGKFRRRNFASPIEPFERGVRSGEQGLLAGKIFLLQDRGGARQRMVVAADPAAAA